MSSLELLRIFEITRQTIPTNRGRVLRVCYAQSQFRKLSAKIKISSKIYEKEKGKLAKMSLFLKTNYLRNRNRIKQC